MLELRKMNLKDAKAQWEYVTAMPADENGVINSHEGVSFEDYMDKALPEEEIYLRVLKSNISSFKVICKNGAYMAGEDETHYLLRVRK